MSSIVYLYLLVAAVSVIMVVVELDRSCDEYLRVAFKYQSTWLLIAVNVVVALVLFSFVKHAFGKTDIGWYTAVLTGMTYPLLLRSRFTYFRGLGRIDDESVKSICLKIDELYFRLQERCYISLEHHLLPLRMKKVEQIEALYTEEELLGLLDRSKYMIRHESIRLEITKRLKDLQKDNLASRRHFLLANLVVQHGLCDIERRSRKSRHN